ncbi:hypothetical protein GCM10018772_68880 [Streptomyces fumanus]|uniref:Uncharacterized protein n=1 Tax=Streptomyces fumanus TaxID=67302 RepID=A0A919EBE6_9ACTN|nr:hypothetical protein GCM10018772_68880 [Streptomyces fumanus]
METAVATNSMTACAAGVPATRNGVAEAAEDTQDHGEAGIGGHHAVGRGVLAASCIVLPAWVDRGLGLPQGGGVGIAAGKVL